ncbi:hypothetical protein AK812_SmicGene36454 [Symbiodinium microadriaticum]|uniref:HPt domain-containing protein n=1 Tax=Symbiodinium microadriaticum TaxID=2951 RepID=A0A1Q9CIV9_SYMMI|nr:hypothetical protein AK812_SmicGene36454 [Symbiodinium microadriaticum]
MLCAVDPGAEEAMLPQPVLCKRSSAAPRRFLYHPLQLNLPASVLKLQWGTSSGLLLTRRRQMSDDTGPREPVLRHMDWTRAMGNHQREEQLRAFLAEYPADLRRKVCDMEQALLSKDFNRLQEAAQQVMGSSSFVAATQLHDLAMELEEAIDLETGSIPDKTARVVQEARELEQELVGAGFVPQDSPELKMESRERSSPSQKEEGSKLVASLHSDWARHQASPGSSQQACQN